MEHSKSFCMGRLFVVLNAIALFRVLVSVIQLLSCEAFVGLTMKRLPNFLLWAFDGEFHLLTTPVLCAILSIGHFSRAIFLSGPFQVFPVSSAINFRVV